MTGIIPSLDKPVPRAHNSAMPSGTEVISTDGRAILDSCVRAATGQLSWGRASAPLTDHNRTILGKALRMDVDQWRAEFGDRLRETGTKLLERLNAAADQLKPGEIAYSLAVVVDKAAALEGRSQIANAAVNVQINNYGASLSKDDLIASLRPVHAITDAIQQANHTATHANIEPVLPHTESDAAALQPAPEPDRQPIPAQSSEILVTTTETERDCKTTQPIDAQQ